MEEFKFIVPNWISGFSVGDGNFYINITQRGSNYQVQLRFRITQHIKDAYLLGLITKYLDCDKV